MKKWFRNWMFWDKARHKMQGKLSLKFYVKDCKEFWNLFLQQYYENLSVLW